MICKGCGEEVEEVFPIKVKGKTKRLCEECIEQAQADGDVEEAALDAVKDMMGYKGSW